MLKFVANYNIKMFTDKMITIIFLIFLFQSLNAQLFHQEYSDEIIDSMEVLMENNPLNYTLEYFNYEQYFLFHDNKKNTILLIDFNKKIIKNIKNDIFKHQILGFGVEKENILHLIIGGCGKKWIDLVSMDLTTQAYTSTLIKYEATSAFYFTKNNRPNFLLQFSFVDFTFLDVHNQKITIKNKIPQIFSDNVSCVYYYPYNHISIVNDTIIAMNYTSQQPIFFIDKKGNFLSSIANPNTAFDNSQLIFKYFPDITKLQSDDIIEYIFNYRYFSPFLFTFLEGKKYYYQFNEISENQKQKEKEFIRFLTIWDENFQVLKNYVLRKRFFIDLQANLYILDYKDNKLKIYNYGKLKI